MFDASHTHFSDRPVYPVGGAGLSEVVDLWSSIYFAGHVQRLVVELYSRA